jgi:ABC-2 type transport system permease protein
MFGNVFLKTIRDQRRGLVGWGIGIGLLVAVEAALWPSIRDMPELKDMLANYPEAMQKMFDFDAMTTASGFLNAELFTLALPVLFLIYGIGHGARMIAGEEEAGTLEAVLVTPVSTTRLALHKAAALAMSLVVIGIVLLVVTVICSAAFGMDIGVGDIATASLAMVLLGVEFGSLALAVGTMTGRRVLAIGVAAAAAVAAYVLYVAGIFVSAVEPWQAWSPFHQALTGGPLGAGLPATYAWMAAAAVIFVAASLPVFDRRDIAAR